MASNDNKGTRRGGAQPAGSVRITDVAALAGVSPITVSRALNTPDLLSKATLRRVRAAVDRLGYVPNLAAGALASRRSRMIVAIVPTIASTMYAAALQAFTSMMAASGYHVLLGLGGFDAQEEERLITAMLGRKPDGVLLVGAVHSPGARRRLARAAIPVVEIWGDATDPCDIQVGFNHGAAGEAVAHHLCDRGFVSFGIVSSGDPRALERLEGFRAALKRRGHRLSAEELLPPPSTILNGRCILPGLVKKLPVGSAIFCSSDLLAAGLLIEAQARGLTVPKDLAICGFGDLEIGQAMEPALTTVRVDGAEMGHLAARYIIGRIAGDRVPRAAALPVEIVQRGTS
jgi:LacI family gluconate utilization system Gnt-I transcriptional repressor